METSSFSPADIQEYKFNHFTSFYNKANGVTVHIPNPYLSYKEKIFSINDFYASPNKASSDSVVTICINLTSECNLICRYCFNDKTRNVNLNTEDALDFIDKIIKLRPNVNRYFVDLAGSGEPLLMLGRILEIADYCRKKQDEILKDVVVRLATNGVLLTPEVAKVLKSHNILFGISLDGYKELNDINRVFIDGAGTYDAVMSNYTRIENKDFIGVAMTFDSDKTDIYKAYMNLAKNFETISIRPARRNYNDFNMSLILEGYEKIKNYIIEQALYNNSISFLVKIINGDDLFGKTILKVISNCYSERRCDAGTSRFALGFDKKVYPCSAYVFDEKSEMNLDELKDLPIYQTCISCSLRYFCGGMCPIQAKELEGNEKLCLLKKKLFLFAVEICGSIQLGNPGLYSDFVKKVNEILLRSERDMDLVKTVKASQGKYTYSNLQSLKFKDLESYTRIKSMYSSSE